MSDHKLILSGDVHDRIFHYVDVIDAEIGMFGYVKLTDNGDFYVDDVFLVKQEVTGSTVDFLDEGLAYAIERGVADGRLEDMMFCCHSHVNMGAFWSATDEDMIAGMNNGMTPYLVSLVVNKKRESKQRVDFFNPQGPFGEFTRQVTFNLDLEVGREVPGEIRKEVEELVTERPLTMGHKHRNWSPTKTKTNRKPEDADLVVGGAGHWDEPSPGQQAWGWEDAETWQKVDDGYWPITNAAGDIIGWEDEYDNERQVEAAMKRGAL